jgi:hypothetical protein
MTASESLERRRSHALTVRKDSPKRPGTLRVSGRALSGVRLESGRRHGMSHDEKESSRCNSVIAR